MCFFQHCQILKLLSCCFHREQICAERESPTPETDFCSTTHKDFCVEGFVPLTPETTQVSVCIYKYIQVHEEIRSTVLNQKHYIVYYHTVSAWNKPQALRLVWLWPISCIILHDLCICYVCMFASVMHTYSTYIHAYSNWLHMFYIISQF